MADFLEKDNAQFTLLGIAFIMIIYPIWLNTLEMSRIHIDSKSKVQLAQIKA